jgi:hypothetical protein
VSVWHGTHVVARQLQLKSKSVASRDRKRGKLPGKHA